MEANQDVTIVVVCVIVLILQSISDYLHYAERDLKTVSLR